jgi:hypothetical protein
MNGLNENSKKLYTIENNDGGHKESDGTDADQQHFGRRHFRRCFFGL